MNRRVNRQAIVGSLLVAMFLITLLVGLLLIVSSIAGAHSSQTGIMLIAPPYHFARSVIYVTSNLWRFPLPQPESFALVLSVNYVARLLPSPSV